MTITVTCYSWAPSSGDHLFACGAISKPPQEAPEKEAPEARASLLLNTPLRGVALDLGFPNFLDETNHSQIDSTLSHIS